MASPTQQQVSKDVHLKFSLFTDHPRPPFPSFIRESAGRQVQKSILQETHPALSDTPHFELLATAFIVLLHRHTAQEEISFGLAKAAAEPERSLPLTTLHLTIPEKITTETLLHEVIAASKMLNSPIEGGRGGVTASATGTKSSPSLAFVYSEKNAQFEHDSHLAQCDLVLKIESHDSNFELNCEYDAELFEARSVQMFLENYENLLISLITQPELEISRLPMLSQKAQQKIIVQCARKSIEKTQEKCLHQRFEAQAAANPEAIALTFDGENISYRALNERANRLAHFLLKHGVQKEELIAVRLDRSVELIVGILGVLKAGAAYLPVDLAYPQDRIDFMLRDADVKMVLSNSRAAENYIAPENVKTVLFDRHGDDFANASTENPNLEISPENLIYVIYTSGSTGKPKGVQITHRNVDRLFTSTQHWFNFNSGDVWTLFHSPAFDFSVWEIWGALVYGGRLVIVPYQTSRSPEDFHALLQREKVTVLNQTPSAFRQFIVADEKAQSEDKLSLRTVIFGGEALDLQSLRPWFERHGDDKPTLVNMYGITETTVHVTYRPIKMADLDSATGSLIGEPIPDLELYILDKHLQPVPSGVPGEIFVGGEGLARGYLNRPELTAEKFISPDEWAPEVESRALNTEYRKLNTEKRLYRTGDLGRFTHDGDVEYLGRIDQQVKIRGFRIELGEIEACLNRHEAIRESVVIVTESGGDRVDPVGWLSNRVNGNAATSSEKTLMAWFVPQSGVYPSHGELAAWLGKRLPDYMVPSSFTMLDRIPLTVNGKIDFRALPKPETTRPDLEARFIAPRNDVERKLAEIYAEALDLEKVGVQDSFFELGGDSLRVGKVIAEIRRRLEVEMETVKLFEYPTIDLLAKHLGKQNNGAQEFADIYKQAERKKSALAQRRHMAKQRVFNSE